MNARAIFVVLEHWMINDVFLFFIYAYTHIYINVHDTKVFPNPFLSLCPLTKLTFGLAHPCGRTLYRYMYAYIHIYTPRALLYYSWISSPPSNFYIYRIKLFSPASSFFKWKCVISLNSSRIHFTLSVFSENRRDTTFSYSYEN